MSNRLKHSIFHKVFFPPKTTQVSDSFYFRKSYRNHLDPNTDIFKTSWVVFDLETTGLNKNVDRVIEIGAVKFIDGEEMDRFSSLVNTTKAIPDLIKNLTGITNQMLEGKPTIDQLIPKLIEFFKGSLLVCHNTAFDMIMLDAELKRINIAIDFDCLCTLKMARDLVVDISDRKLVTLAKYYNLEYTTHHRSLSDASVTGQVLKKILADYPKLKTWNDLRCYAHLS